MRCVVVLLLCIVPCVPAPPGKSTIAASDAMHSLAFNLKYLPVTPAQDNGAGNMMRQMIQGRVQVLQNASYTQRNCQLFSGKGSLAQGWRYQSMTPNGLGKDCTYRARKQYTSGAKLHKVFAYNKGQCCNACVATEGCVAASFLTSGKDHSGGFGPQTWEGFGIHITDVTSAKTSGGITVAELEGHFRDRFGNFSQFDKFMDYSVTFFTYSLKPYIAAFTEDRVPFFLAQWTAEQTQDTWYSLFFLVKASHYVIELTSTMKPMTGSAPLPRLEQRMSDAHVKKFKSYGDHPAHILLISSINRATSDVARIDEVYTKLFMAKPTHEVSEGGVTRRCYNTGGQSSDAGVWPRPPPRPPVDLDEDVCFTQRAADVQKDTIFSVSDFEQMLWAEHASTLANYPSSMVDKYTDNHYAQPMNPAGLQALAVHFRRNNPYPITKDTRLAYACKQSYIIDPTGWSIQPIGPANWPRCGWDNLVV